MACQGSLARFLEPTLEGSNWRAQESSQPDRRDVSPLCGRIRCVSPNAEISATRLWHGECFWLMVDDIVPHFRNSKCYPEPERIKLFAIVICFV